jgi:two-component system cell cycle sensor histidine kinase/response regulator CckA
MMADNSAPSQQASRFAAERRLARGLVHELNNQLYAMQGFTELTLASVPEGSGQHANLQRALEACSAARELLDQLSAHAQGATARPEVVDLRRVLPETLRLLRRSLPPDIRVRARVEPALPPVRAPLAAIQLLIDLLVESVRVPAESSETLIELEATPVDRNGAAWVRLAAHNPNRALGVSSAVARGAANPGPTDAMEAAPSAATNLATELAGRLRVQPHPDGGAVVAVELPCVPLLDSAARPQPAWAGARGRVLLVDDEPALLSLGREMLEILGHTVEVAGSAEEGLSRFQGEPTSFACVVTDLTMPRMSGHELLAAIRVMRADQPVVVTTGYSDRPVGSSQDSAQPTVFLQKPFTIASLGAAIERALKASDRPNGG